MARIWNRPPLFDPLGGSSARWLGLLLPLLLSTAAARPASAQDTPDFFAQNCASCHTIGGGRRAGPDLKDVTLRQKDRDWLIKFMMNPTAVLKSNDPYAKQILKESNNVPMPALPGMTRERAEKLLQLIEAESKLEKSQFKGLQISTEPFTKEDQDRGREIFIGLQPLTEGGAACISCHSMHDIKALGGGRLGPDLTNISEKYDRTALSAWLDAPGTETMRPIFNKKNHPIQADEIHALVAYFESAAAEQPANASVSRVTFLLLGLAGAAIFVFMFDAIWKRRFHAVRKPLVKSLQITR